MRNQEKRNTINRFTIKMQKKLLILFMCILAAFAGLSVQLFLINRDNGEDYKSRYCRSRNMTLRQYLLNVVPS